MDRRNFLAAAGAVAALGAAGAAAQPAPGAGNQFLELRKYLLLPDKKVLENYLRDAAIPAWNRAGVGPVGVMTVKYGRPAIYVLLTHKSLDSVWAARKALAEDQEHLKAGEAFLNAPPESPAFYRVESSLLRAFDGMPQVAVPPQAQEKKPRIFELRIYESHSPAFGKKKVKMFNSGEIDIFKKAGTNPVFFAETIAGAAMPNLHYMLCFDDFKARDAGWKAFGGSPEWKALSGSPEFTPDPVSNITDIILQPTGYSQI